MRNSLLRPSIQFNVPTVESLYSTAKLNLNLLYFFAEGGVPVSCFFFIIDLDFGLGSGVAGLSKLRRKSKRCFRVDLKVGVEVSFGKAGLVTGM